MAEECHAHILLQSDPRGGLFYEIFVLRRVVFGDATTLECVGQIVSFMRQCILLFTVVAFQENNKFTNLYVLLS